MKTSRDYTMNNLETLEKVRIRIEARLGFYAHLMVFIAIMTFLIIINLSFSSNYLWFRWPLTGWGVAVFLHAKKVFGQSDFSALKQRLIEMEMRKESMLNQE